MSNSEDGTSNEGVVMTAGDVHSQGQYWGATVNTKFTEGFNRFGDTDEPIPATPEQLEAAINQRRRDYASQLGMWEGRLKTYVEGGLLTWAILGQETAPTTKRLHFQIAVKYQRNQRYNSVIANMPGAHVQAKAPRASVEQFIAYHEKEGAWQEWGERPRSAGRATQDRHRFAIERARAGDFEAIVDEQPELYLNHHSTLLRIFKDTQPPVAELDIPGGCLVWIQGPSGCGKSRKARADYPGAYAKTPSKWFDGYGQDPNRVVVIDDLDPTHSFLGYHLKVWCDRYPFIAEEKGGSKLIRPRFVVVTSQYKIEDIFHEEETRAALQRRATVVELGPLRNWPIFNMPPAGSVPRTVGVASDLDGNVGVTVVHMTGTNPTPARAPASGAVAPVSAVVVGDSTPCPAAEATPNTVRTLGDFRTPGAPRAHKKHRGVGEDTPRPPSPTPSQRGVVILESTDDEVDDEDDVSATSAQRS